MKIVRVLVRTILWLGAGFTVLAAVGVFAVWLFLKDLPDPCGNTEIAEYTSPDGTKKLVVFERDCGATTGFNTHASLLNDDAELGDEGGNLFAAGSNREAAASGPSGGPDLKAFWRDARHLVLSHHPKVHVFRSEREADGVHVQYIHEP